MTRITIGEYKNKRGETVKLDAIDGRFYTDSCNNFYYKDGTCYFWSWKNDRFFKNTDLLSDIEVVEPLETKCKLCGK